jgi:glutamate/tyrosine decarboxylase-like PLP-dependent enzyme
MICMVKIRFLQYDKDYSLRGETLQQAFDEDIKNGLIPFYVKFLYFLTVVFLLNKSLNMIKLNQVAGTFGTTCCCSFDRVDELGPKCQNYNVYLHVDAAYAGNSLICEEFRYLMPGIEVNTETNLNIVY